jgi:hypothetical protein
MDDKLRELVQEAIEKTKNGSLKWTAFDEDTFRARIGTGFLHIQRSSTQLSSDGETFYDAETQTVQISDERGRVAAEGEAAIGYDGFGILNELFLEARKSALGTDKLIENMLHSLRSGAIG